MGVNYWNSKFNVTNPSVNDFATALDKTALLTAGINTTVFKPLNEKNFLIFQASADVNGLFENAKAIQNKAITLIVCATDFFKVAQYAAFQLIHTLVAYVAHMNSRFFTAYTASAKGHHSFVYQLVFMFFDYFRELTELGNAIVNGVFKSPDVYFKCVARIDHHHGFAIIVMPLI